MSIRKNNKKFFLRKISAPLKIGGIFVLGGLFLGFSLFVFYIKDLPRPEKFTESIIAESTKIYDSSGEILLYEIFGEEKRTVVPLSDMPQSLRWAVISVEDKNFLKHSGLDLRGVMRAILYDLKIQKPVQGASTITQQLIRNYFLTKQKTLKRKTREAVLSLEMERRYSKEQILEWYLNLIPFGSNLYGVEEASRTFFDKSVSEVSLEESAILAALIKKPSYLSPYGENKEELFLRKNLILEKMKEQGFIEEKEFMEAKNKEIVFYPKKDKIKAPHFSLFVKQYLENKYGRDFLERKGLKVFTTIDYNTQKAAEKIVMEGIKNIENYNANNGNLVALNPKNGEILAMVGSKNYFASSTPTGCSPGIDCVFDPKVNTIFSLRQPGSAFKPFIYAKNFINGLTPDTILWDVKTEFNINCSPNADKEFSNNNTPCYHPQNYNGRHSGPISIKSALAQSINIPAVKALYLAGVKNIINFVENFGIKSFTNPDKYGLSLVLGGGEVTLMEMVEGYSVFASGGLKTSVKFIKKIEDRNGNIIEKPQTSQTRIIPSQIADEINQILKDNKLRAPMFGLNSPLYIKDFEAAVKTGTTQNYKDGWVIGYTPSLVAGVWVGNNNSEPMAAKPSVSLAGPIWNNFIREAIKGKNEKFKKPASRKSNIPILNGALIENHSILHYLNREDSAYYFWEKGIENFLKK